MNRRFFLLTLPLLMTSLHAAPAPDLLGIAVKDIAGKDTSLGALAGKAARRAAQPAVGNNEDKDEHLKNNKKTHKRQRKTHEKADQNRLKTYKPHLKQLFSC